MKFLSFLSILALLSCSVENNRAAPEVIDNKEKTTSLPLVKNNFENSTHINPHLLATKNPLPKTVETKADPEVNSFELSVEDSIQGVQINAKSKKLKLRVILGEFPLPKNNNLKTVDICNLEVLSEMILMALELVTCHDVPASSLDQISEIHFNRIVKSEDELRILHYINFSMFKNLKALTLSYEDPMEDSDLYSQLSGLERLVLNDIYAYKFSLDSLKSLQNLQSLAINSVNLEQIEVNDPKILPELKLLDVSGSPKSVFTGRYITDFSKREIKFALKSSKSKNKVPETFSAKK